MYIICQIFGLGQAVLRTYYDGDCFNPPVVLKSREERRGEGRKGGKKEEGRKVGGRKEGVRKEGQTEGRAERRSS